MSDARPSPERFDASSYTALELSSARRVIHSLYRHPDSAEPDGPFDPASYSQVELALAAEVIAALRRGPSEPPQPRAKVTVREGPGVEWRRGEAGRGGSQARLILQRTTTTVSVCGTASWSVETLGPLTDWFDCPQPLDRRRESRPTDGAAGAAAVSYRPVVPQGAAPWPAGAVTTCVYDSTSGKALGPVRDDGSPPSEQQ